MQDLAKVFGKAISFFVRKKGTTLAAASSFYCILTIVPLTLFFIKIIGLVLGDLKMSETQFFELTQIFFPEVAPTIFQKLKDIIQAPLFAPGSVTIVNFLVLIWTSLALFNSIWNGLFLMTGDKSHTSFLKHLKGLIFLGLSSVIILITLGVPILINFVSKLINTSEAYKTVILKFPHVHSYLQDLFSNALVTGLSPLRIIFFTLYFMFVFRWFFSFKISRLQSFIASSSFVAGLYIAKLFFAFYLNYVRVNMLAQYGNTYIVVLAILWIFFVMNIFFFCASVCHTLHSESLFSKKLIKKVG